MKNKNRNSPHNNGSLHNHPPRKIRNIVPEVPTQNVPALPHNSSPLIRQHRSHSCNKKPRSQIQTQNTKLKNKKLYIGKTYGYNPMAAKEDHALPDTHNADLGTHSGQMSSQKTPAATREEPGIQRQEEGASSKYRTDSLASRLTRLSSRPK